MKNPGNSFFHDLVQTLRKVGLLIYALTLIESSADQWITGQMQDLLMSSEGTGPMLYVYGLCSMSFSLFFPSLILFFIVTSFSSEATLSQLSAWRRFELLMIESLRSWGQILRWSFLFLIPGFIKWVELSFVPFVVLSSKKYQDGSSDALKASSQIARGHRLQILGILILMGIILPLGLTTFEDYKILWKTPVASLAYYSLESLMTIALGLWMYRLFLKWGDQKI